MTSSKAIPIPRTASPWPGHFTREMEPINPEDQHDGEEMFLFDEDIGLKRSNTFAPFHRTTSVMKDLINLKHQSKQVDEDCLFDQDMDDLGMGLSLPRSEDVGNLLYSNARHFYFYGQSPAASSVDSEASASMTIEGLRNQLQSCFTCGVIWREDQATLDCDECDGYAMTRDCPECEGICRAVWRRDIHATHETHRAKWIGSCKLDLRKCSIETESSSSSCDSR